MISATFQEREYAEKCLLKYEQRKAEGAKKNTTDYRWDKLSAAAVALGAPPLAGLLPYFSSRGGREIGYDKETKSRVVSAVKEIHAKLNGKASDVYIYGKLKKNIADQSTLPSLETMRRW